MRNNIAIKKKKLLDIFIISNFAFLTLDIFYAHSINNFSHQGEWIPLYFSAFAAITLFFNSFFRRDKKIYLSTTIGILSIVVGTLGIYYHMESQFFQNTSLKSLIYTAPLVAPLSYTALGLLIFVNLYVPSQGLHFGQWIVILSYIGFAGNFILSLLDHAQNGFFHMSEWIPVISAACILSFVPMGFYKEYYFKFKPVLKFILWLQIFVGVLGFFLHLYPILSSNEGSIIDRVLYGPPVLAPLLYCNLAVLMAFGWRSIIDHEKKEVLLRGWFESGVR